MNKSKMMNVRKIENDKRAVRTELLLAPLLVVFPFIAGIVFIHDWYTRGFLMSSSIYDGELILGLIIIFGNIIFDIPFIKSLRNFTALFRKTRK